MKKLIRKGYSGLSLSSSPLAVNYGYSMESAPDYSNSFNFNLLNFASGLNFSVAPLLSGYNVDFSILSLTQSPFKTEALDSSIKPTSVTPTIGIDSLNKDLQSYASSLPLKTPFTVKFANSTFGRNYGNWSSGLNMANEVFTAIAGEKSEYDGDKGAITQGLDKGYDVLLSAVSVIPGIGLIISLGMGANKLLGNVVNKLGGGTDGMCVCAGTIVFKANGEIVNIEDLKQEDGIIGWCEKEKRIKPQIISILVEPRLKDCVEIILDSGQVLRCSFDHPIYTRNGIFVPAYLLKIGDIVLSADLDSNIYKSEVVSVLPIGVLTVYNLQADNDHTYLANGIITHNTTADAILGSSFLLLTPFGMINGFGGKRADTITKDEEAFETVGSSYGGTSATVDEALTKSGKKYGLFSSRARRKANELIAEAKRLQSIMSDIADTATDRFNIQQSTAAINENRRAFALQGGYQQANMRVGKKGMSLELILKTKLILKSPKTPLFKNGGLFTEIVPVSQFKSGGTVVKSTEIIPVELFLKGGKTNKKSRTLEELIEYAKKENPRFVQRLSEPVKDIEFTNKEGNKARGTHYLAWGIDDNGNAIVHPTIMEDDNGNLKYYGDDAYNRAIEKHDFLIMTPEEAELFTVSGEDENGNLFGYKVGWKEFFKAKKYQEGGSVNVIPKGALHARKHHMDIEGITPKGIPVVDNNGLQQAEIEREELIIRLEVTKRLEELCKKYYSEESSTSEKDLYALEAGKLLTDEILHNTIDNTNLIKLI